MLYCGSTRMINMSNVDPIGFNATMFIMEKLIISLFLILHL